MVSHAVSLGASPVVPPPVTIPAPRLVMSFLTSLYSSPRSGPVCDRREVTGEGRSTETGADKRKQTGSNSGMERINK